MKVGIITKNDGFLAPILSELEKREHEILRMHFSDDEAFNIASIQRVMDHSDVCFFDFAQFPLVIASHLIPKTCKNVVRMHGIEVYYHAKSVNWTAVDHLVLTQPQLRRFQKLNVESFPDTTVLPIGTDVDFFRPPEKKEFGKKLLLVAATLQPRKRVYTTIETLAPLLLEDGYTLTIKGSVKTGFRDPISQEYSLFIDELIESLDIRSKVFLIDEFLKLEDYRQMFWDHDFIISNSMQEGYHKVIADAVACGMIPVIKYWPYCDEIWPDGWIVHSQSHMVDRIKQVEELMIDGATYGVATSREWLIENGHDEKQVAKQIVDIMEAV